MIYYYRERSLTETYLWNKHTINHATQWIASTKRSSDLISPTSSSGVKMRFRNEKSFISLCTKKQKWQCLKLFFLKIVQKNASDDML